MAGFTSLLKQSLRNTFREGPSNRPATFVQIQRITSLEETMREQAWNPQYNPTFVQSTILTLTRAIINEFSNESYKINMFDDID